MLRSDDGKNRSGLNWLMAALVMAAPLAWVGSHALEEPLYVVHAAAAVDPSASYFPEDAGLAARARGSKDIRHLEATGQPLAVVP
ncbi:hypothetical protein [Dyella terrae]|uniref:hypothetical protein n=1 Tax=Dyella terrae TaxID=522259 RepID=UPI001EFC8360|nr:hypothetical protein [Dyella terrae]ULU24664.1 hypothetical protein DYST_01584 [Dyella terrae]